MYEHTHTHTHINTPTHSLVSSTLFVSLSLSHALYISLFFCLCLLSWILLAFASLFFSCPSLNPCANEKHRDAVVYTHITHFVSLFFFFFFSLSLSLSLSLCARFSYNRGLLNRLAISFFAFLFFFLSFFYRIHAGAAEPPELP